MGPEQQGAWRGSAQEVAPESDSATRPLQTGAEPTEPEKAGDKPRWNAQQALLGLLVAMVASVMLGFVMLGFFLAFGVNDPENSSAFGFAATIAQAAMFVTVALTLTYDGTRPPARQFGFRKFGPSALGWAIAAYVAFLALVLVYTQFVHLPEEQLPFTDEKPGGLEAVMTGIMVIGIAPPVEEFFFRGFLYQGLRGRLGVLGAALTSGAIFGAVHLGDPARMGVLAILGVLLALLFERTKSLWPCIVVHATNNTIAFVLLITT